MNSSLLKSNTILVKILLVEDEEKLARNLKRALEKQGYFVYIASSAEEAESFLLRHDDAIDLIVLDSMLPGKSGVDLSKTLRKRGQKISILMLTAKDTAEDIVAGLDAGVDDYLVKPFSLDVLYAHIRALIRRFQKVDIVSSKIQINDLVLDSAKRKVLYKNKEISFTLKEFNLLQYLMEHANTVLGREEILEKIWDINFDSFSNVVDVHVKNIRKKLKEAGSLIIPETIRGIGYKIQK